MRDILLFVFVFAGSGVALFRPFVGLLLFTFLGFFNPHSFTWSFAQTFPFSQVAALSTIIGYLISSERKGLPPQREVLMLIGLWVMFGISTFLGIFPDESWPKLTLISKIFLMVLLTTALVNTEERLHALLRVISFSLGFYAVKGTAFVILSGGEQLVYGPEGSFLAANNTIGLALAMNVPILLYLLKREKHHWLRWMIMGMVFCSYPAVICTYSRGAWLGLAMVTALLVLKTKYKIIIVPVAGFAAVILVALAPLIAPQRLAQRYGDLVNYEQEKSAESRFWSWEFCRRVGVARPLTGAGFGFYAKELYPIYYPEFVAYWGPNMLWSCHSMWFTVFAEHGFPGFALWAALLVSCFAGLRRMRRYARTYPELAWMNECATALQGAFVAYIVVGTFLDAAYFDMFYYLIAMVICMKEMARKFVLEASAQLVTAMPPVLAPVAEIGKGYARDLRNS
jgi:probable O-glycosylation ligase (exosortase A-associated)